VAKLVVVGNGMAGARALEEILRRGGGERFDITVFGDEPYGNYNRILLSNVLAGIEDTSEIYLNPVGWYAENSIDLRAGVRVVRIDRFTRLVQADDGTSMHYDRLVIATGSRSFQVLFGPENGCTRATLFVGYVPPGRAPWHFHQYDEIVWIWNGTARYHLGQGVSELRSGDAVRVHPREVHVIENLGGGDLALLGLFTPAGSPSAAYLAPVPVPA